MSYNSLILSLLLKSAHLFSRCIFLNLCFLWLFIWIFFNNLIKNRLRSLWLRRLLKDRFERELIANRLRLFRDNSSGHSFLLFFNSSLHYFSEISRRSGNGFWCTDFALFLDLLYRWLILVHQPLLVLTQLCLKIIIILLHILGHVIRRI
jgi:hypothetical protein